MKKVKIFIPFSSTLNTGNASILLSTKSSIKKAFNNKCEIIVDSYQATIAKKYYPEINYNSFSNSFSAFYAKFSMVESLGFAVLESISFGAIPIISNKGVLPEIFVDCSILVDTNKFDKGIKTLKKRINSYSINKDKIKKVVNKHGVQNRYSEPGNILL